MSWWESAVQQARRLARRHGVAQLTSFYEGRFPAHLPRDQREPVIRPGRFGFIMERAFLQHVGHGGLLERTVELLATSLVSGGIFYSLMIAREGASGHWGITRWSEREIRAAVEPWFTIREMRRDVFTPGEPGSVPAWITVMSPRLASAPPMTYYGPSDLREELS